MKKLFYYLLFLLVLLLVFGSCATTSKSQAEVRIEFFELKPGLTPELIDEITKDFHRLVKEVPGLIEILASTRDTYGISLSGYTYAVIMRFEDSDAKGALYPAPYVPERMKKLADSGLISAPLYLDMDMKVVTVI